MVSKLTSMNAIPFQVKSKIVLEELLEDIRKISKYVVFSVFLFYGAAAFI